jgi:hypothetical protein
MTKLTSRKISIWSEPVRHVTKVELDLPAYWIEEEWSDSTGEKRKMFCRLTENGVKTKITRTGAMGKGAVDALWAIETTFSSAWSDPRAVMPYGFIGRARPSEPLTAVDFDALEAKIDAMIRGEPEPAAGGPKP